MRVLSVNVGSSSLKVALWQVGSDERLVARGEVKGLGRGEARLRLRDGDGRTLRDEGCGALEDAAAATLRVLEVLAGDALPFPDAVGHRLVHGGPDLSAPARVDDALLRTLVALEPYAPLHLPAEIAVVRAVAERHRELPQVVCFDTAFHRRMPAVAQRLPLPRALHDEGVRRYGFHGLSYEYVVSVLGDAARGRTVIAHLGNGASLAAVRDGAPIDTTMGLTPTGGLMMGTRSGDLDPGVLLHLARVERLDAPALERLVDQCSGLLGVSGGSSGDVAALLERRTGDVAAAEAIELFCWIARKHVGAMAASLGGLDTLVFTGGIGEHATPVRAEICAGLGHLGVVLDPAANAAAAPLISAADARCTVRIVATDEERMIARHVQRTLAR
jgi:acetate kinase